VTKAAGILLVLVAALGLTQTALAQTPRLIDPGEFFSLIPPQGWAVSRSMSPVESQVKADLEARGAFFTATARPVAAGLAWTDWEARLKTTLPRQLGQPRFGPHRLCGRPALAVVGTSLENPSMTVEMVAGLKDGLGFVLTMAYPSEAWASFRPVFEAVLESFQCLKRP